MHSSINRLRGVVFDSALLFRDVLQLAEVLLLIRQELPQATGLSDLWHFGTRVQKNLRLDLFEYFQQEFFRNRRLRCEVEATGQALLSDLVIHVGRCRDQDWLTHDVVWFGPLVLILLILPGRYKLLIVVNSITILCNLRHRVGAAYFSLSELFLVILIV